jgi:hypothetical protein
MIDFGKDALSRIPFKTELGPNQFEIRIASPNGDDIIAYGKKDDLVIQKRCNDNGSIQIVVAGIQGYRRETVPGVMEYASEDTDPFGHFRRIDGLY